LNEEVKHVIDPLTDFWTVMNIECCKKIYNICWSVFKPYILSDTEMANIYDLIR